MALNSTADAPNETTATTQVNSVATKPTEVQQLYKLVTELHQEVKYLKANDAKPINNSVDFNPKTGKPLHSEFLNIWLETLTNKFNDYSLPVASNLLYTNTTSDIAKLDSGTTQHYLKPSHQSYLQNLTLTIGPNIQLPNNDELKITHTGQLPLDPNLPSSVT